MEGFFELVYRIVAQIPEGKVVTYGQIATCLGKPGSARVVGWAMRTAPSNLPWHRVVDRFGYPKCRTGGMEVHRAKLEAEGVTFNADGCVDLEKYLWNLAITII